TVTGEQTPAWSRPFVAGRPGRASIREPGHSGRRYPRPGARIPRRAIVDHAQQVSVLLLSTSDTDLLAARASGADYRLANPARLPAAGLPPLLDGADVVVVRLLGGEQAWPEGLAALRRHPGPLVVLGGEMVPDAALMCLSSVPAGIASQAHEYLAHGGPGN